ncbi:uncharacterized protein PG998_008717 [Apiospora kogelbergensis]|uniref:uncharacterized protein n=1 Tax=Apiospora kogelbergensis TaxID=1337665 RepID=UPI00312FB70C
MAKKTAASKGRTARPPQKPLRPFPISHHPPTYVAISCNLTNYQPQPGDGPAECIDMGVAVFRGEPPFYSYERADTSLPALMKQAECYHVINKKHRKAQEASETGNDTLYTSLYAKSQILEDEDEMKDWLWQLLQDSRKIRDNTPTWPGAKCLEANREQIRLSHGATWGATPPAGSQEATEKVRNLVLMDWGAAGTDKLLQRWGTLGDDRLRVREGNRVQFWDLRQWDRVAALAPNPCAEPRDFTAALRALGVVYHRFEAGGQRSRDVRGNAGNDACLKLGIFFSFFAMTAEEEAGIMLMGQPLDRDYFLFKYDAETLKANQGLANLAE